MIAAARHSGANRLVVAAVLVIITALGGCTVTPRNPPPVSEKVAQVLQAGDGQFDLTRPPSREEAGMPAGQGFVTYGGVGRPPLHVRIVLPEGRELDVESTLVGFDSYGSAHPEVAPPSAMDVFHDPASRKDGLVRLLTDARAFGLDTTDIADWYEKAGGPAPAIDETVRSPWITSRIGYLTFQVQASYDRARSTGEQDRTVIHYLISWDPPDPQ